jgi:hypothetical protein
MRNFTIAAAALVVLGIMLVATVASRRTALELGRAEGFSATVMPIEAMTLNAKNLPEQKFDAF